jgi:probable F420-dependent oxidoreductase
MELGRVGVWTWGFDHLPWGQAADAAREVEELGYGTLWFGEGTGRDAPTQSALLLGATRRIVVAPGVASIPRHEPTTLARAERTLAEAFPGRFLLGLGVGAKIITDEVGRPWTSPVATMARFLDAMDAATTTAPAPPTPSPRVLAALGPHMLDLAGRRTWGAHPFMVPVEHTAYARERLGPDAVLAVHQNVLLDPDRTRARETGRAALAAFIANVHIAPSRWRMIKQVRGLDESDLAGGGSDRLVDALIAAGDVGTVAARVEEQFDAGADHVCISVVTPDPHPVVGLPALRELAPALLGAGLPRVV